MSQAKWQLSAVREVAALVRNEVQILTGQMQMQLQKLRGEFLQEIREVLYQMKHSLNVRILHSCLSPWSYMDVVFAVLMWWWVVAYATGGVPALG